jgi:phosphomannomutase
MPDCYQCPGETYSISREVHLGRLASFYPNCRDCAHREDTGTLSKQLVKQFAETRRRKAPKSLFTDEGVLGVYRNELDAATTRRVAAAFAARLRQSHASLAPTVMLASDGRAVTPELVAAASEGLRWSGCRVLHIGSATTACLAFSLLHEKAAGGIAVGNPGGDPHMVGLKFWGSDARPLSAGADLEELERMSIAPDSRPTRSFGSLARAQVTEPYLAGLRDYFHALRPLKLVLDTGSQPLLAYVQDLAAHVACEILPAPQFRKVDPQPRTHASNRRTTSMSLHQRRLHGLADYVRAQHAHFGMWIDGDGETCRLIDELGQLVASEHVLLVLHRYLQKRPSAPGEVLPVVLENDASAKTIEVFRRAGVPFHASGPRRNEMHASLLTSGATLGGGASGRFWFCDPRPSPDALRALALLLTVLSQSDRTFSEVLARSLEPARSSE